MASVLTTVRDLDRLRQITAVLVRHGFGEVVQRTGLGSFLKSRDESPEGASKIALSARIRMVLEDLGPSFVKLGQLVSTRPDLIPADIIRELTKLQDDVPAISYEAVKEVVESELGATLTDVFQSFDEKPLASASIGQVHRAVLRTKDGLAEVVVKVQRPSVKKTVERDLDLLHMLAKLIEQSIPESRIYSPTKLVAEFDRAIHAELDYTLEADNAERFAANFAGHPAVRFPMVYRDQSTRRVLTLEYLPGHKVHEAVRLGVQGDTIAKRAVDIVIKQIFEDGFFHADPHPGNVLILGEPLEPVLGLIDLGLVGRLTPQMRDRTIDLMVAAIREDYRGIADALYAIGRPMRRVDRQAFEAKVALLSDRYLGKQLKDIEVGVLIRDLVGAATEFGIEIPADFLLVGKALMTVEGVGKEIYPELDVFEEVKPYFLRLAFQRYSPERIGEDVVRGVLRLSSAASDMPVQVKDLLDELRSGTLEIRLNEAGLQAVGDRIGRRIFSGLGVAALLVSAALLAADAQYWLAAATLVGAISWANTHIVLNVWLERHRRRRERF